MRVLEILGEPLQPGVVVARVYRLERVVGEGGMGVVWAARELASDREVALKFLREGRETDPRNQERFLREAHAAMAISHPNIARIEAVLETDAGVPFLVMDLLEGESLRAHLRRRGALTPVECARVLLPVVDAVAAAHASHVVHRDLKPENVFLERAADGERVRVLDFGIAKLLPKGDDAPPASLTSTGALLGTPHYMAPEQVFGDEDVDGRADVWSIGIILYECLAAMRPTDGDGFGPIIRRITTDTLVPLEQARAGLPRRITSLAGRMLSRKREDRPSLVEIRAVLANILEDGEGAAESERAPEPASSTTDGVAGDRAPSDAPSTPRPKRRGLTLALVVAAIAALGGTFALGTRARTPAAVVPLPRADDASAGWQVTSKLLQEATAAQTRRDGATCLTRLGAYDATLTAPGSLRPSTDAASGFAGSRAMCLMLTGQCEAGEKLYRAWVTPFIAADAGIDIEQTVESVASDYCAGTMSPRLLLLQASTRFSQVTSGTRKATSAECEEWRANLKRLIPQVPPRGNPDFTLMGATAGAEERAATCFAHAGDCAKAFSVYRESWLKQSADDGWTLTEREAFMRRSYDAAMSTTPCRGKP